MDSDDDYMSDAFLNPKNDIRPGLIHSHSVKRKINNERKSKEENKKAKMSNPKNLEESKRSEGLENAISDKNKGFELLKKMGFKPGMTLGKNNENALKEPISIVLKSDRKGLGTLTKQKENAQKLEQFRAKRENIKAELLNDFTKRVRSKFSEKYLAKDLYESQKICKHFDQLYNIEEPEYSWFWPELKACEDEENDIEKDNEDELKEEEEIEDSIDDYEKLRILTEYLRTNYFYCIWCGVSYYDEEDLKNNCEGDTRELHDS